MQGNMSHIRKALFTGKSYWKLPLLPLLKDMYVAHVEWRHVRCTFETALLRHAKGDHRHAAGLAITNLAAPITSLAATS